MLIPQKNINTEASRTGALINEKQDFGKMRAKSHKFET